MEGDDEDITKDPEKTVDKNVSSAGDVAASSENNLADKDVKDFDTKDEGKMEESPVMGLLAESKLLENKVVETEDTPKNESPSEITVKEAMSKRAAYFKANSEYASVLFSCEYFCHANMTYHMSIPFEVILLEHFLMYVSVQNYYHGWRS